MANGQDVIMKDITGQMDKLRTKVVATSMAYIQNDYKTTCDGLTDIMYLCGQIQASAEFLRQSL